MHKIWVLWIILIYINPFWKSIFWKCIKGALQTSVNWSELHLSEVTSYKIHILVKHFEHSAFWIIVCMENLLILVTSNKLFVLVQNTMRNGNNMFYFTIESKPIWNRIRINFCTTINILLFGIEYKENLGSI